jgi:hypothetical protein
MTSRRLHRVSVKALRRLRGYASGLAAIVMTAAPAAAQATLPERVLVDLNAGVQEGPTRLAVQTPLPAFGREGTLTVDDNVIGGGLFDVSGVVKVHGEFAVGAGYSRTSSTGLYLYTAVVPSPIGTILPVTFTDTTPLLLHREEVVYVKASWVRASGNRAVYAVSAGPAFFRVQQDIPFTSAQLVGGLLTTFVPTVTRFKESSVGFHVGVDLDYIVARHLGGGVLLRYTRGSVEFPTSTKAMIVGGVQLGVGLRARF